MQGSPLTRLDTVEAELAEANDKSASLEQSRNGQTHQRVYDPQVYKMQKEILEELKKMNAHLSIITGEEDVS